MQLAIIRTGNEKYDICKHYEFVEPQKASIIHSKIKQDGSLVFNMQWAQNRYQTFATFMKMFQNFNGLVFAAVYSDWRAPKEAKEASEKVTSFMIDNQ